VIALHFNYGAGPVDTVAATHALADLYLPSKPTAPPVVRRRRATNPLLTRAWQSHFDRSHGLQIRTVNYASYQG
jgi:hypothetical protein